MIEVTPIYAGLIAILMAVLSTRVGLLRGKYGIGMGDGGKADLALNIRRFGNLAEYAPMVIILMALMELNGAGSQFLHIFGSTFIILRLIHPIILFASAPAPMWKMIGRFVSAAGTALLMVIAAYMLILD